MLCWRWGGYVLLLAPRHARLRVDADKTPVRHATSCRSARFMLLMRRAFDAIRAAATLHYADTRRLSRAEP